MSIVYTALIIFCTLGSIGFVLALWLILLASEVHAILRSRIRAALGSIYRHSPYRHWRSSCED